MKKIVLLAAAALAVLTLTACEIPAQTAPARVTEQRAAASNQMTLLQKHPVPKLNDSLERANLIERATFLNNQNFQSCVYLFADNGAMVAFYPVKRKVSSLNSYLLSGDQIVPDQNTSMDGRQSLVVEQPDIDGAYGQNMNGIFFFTLDTNEYVEWYGSYLYTSACSKVAPPTLITREAVE